MKSEPMLGPVDIYKLESQVDWVICGGESGPGARPMNPDWARDLSISCGLLNIPFFFKQWGGVRKKEAGRLLDGLEYNEYPEAR